jgi:hypothetical protein
MRVQPLTSWLEWYRFARERLEQGHQEAIVYANLRSAEELNRRMLRERPPA